MNVIRKQLPTRATVGRILAKRSMTRFTRPPKQPAPGPEVKPPTMKPGVCCMCQGKAEVKMSREFRLKIRRSQGKTERLIFLVCATCEPQLPMGTIEATQAVIRHVTMF